MASWLVLLGLILALLGSALLVWDQVRANASQVRFYVEKGGRRFPNNPFARVALVVARKFGSTDPRDGAGVLGRVLPPQTLGPRTLGARLPRASGWDTRGAASPVRGSGKHPYPGIRAAGAYTRP
jgi:hypothetical protein